MRALALRSTQYLDRALSLSSDESDFSYSSCLPEEPSVYFVHAYYVAPKDPGLVATETDYPTPFTSAIWQDNVFGTQFHPEKSQRVGLAMLENFARL